MIHKYINSKSPKEHRNFRSKAVNVDSFPSSFYDSSGNTINTFSLRAVIEPLPNRCLEEKTLEADFLKKEKNLSQNPNARKPVEE